MDDDVERRQLEGRKEKGQGFIAGNCLNWEMGTERIGRDKTRERQETPDRWKV